MIKTYITEEQEVYLEGLALLLGQAPDVALAGNLLNRSGLTQVLPLLDADVLLPDVHLPDIDAANLIKSLRPEKPRLKIIYLTRVRGTRILHRWGEPYGWPGEACVQAPPAASTLPLI